MVKLKGYFILLIGIYLITAFITASINPFAWPWIARLSMILVYLGLVVYIDMNYQKKS
jgi:hypothetical protein